MSSFLLWAQRQEISTSHTSESGVQEDSHSKCVPLRDFGGKIGLFVRGSCTNPYKRLAFHSGEEEGAGRETHCSHMQLFIYDKMLHHAIFD